MIQRLRATLATLLLFTVSLGTLCGDSAFVPPAEIDEHAIPMVKNIAQHYGARRVLAILAHPDDEQFAISLLYEASKSGSEVTLLTATRGEKGRISHIMRNKIRPTDLGVEREHEVREVGHLIGITHQEVWNFPDNGLADLPRTVLNKAVRDGLCKYQPDFLVTFDPNSGYTGHRDHRRIGLTAVQMATKLATQPCENGYRGPSEIVYPLTPTKGYKRHASARGRLAVKRAARANLAMPAPSWLRIAGWKIHKVQDNPLVRSFGMNEKELYARWTKEYYRVFSPLAPEARVAPKPNARSQGT